MCIWPGEIDAIADVGAIAERLKDEYGVERQDLPEAIRNALAALRRSAAEPPR